jgi:tyrosyl-DNA phosphodiesterase-1
LAAIGVADEGGNDALTVHSTFWCCARCGEQNDEAQCDEQCGVCSMPRWTHSSFTGTRFFVTRTKVDRFLDCSFERLRWTQLLCPPNDSERLVALFASGLVGEAEKVETFAAQFFPPNVVAWVVAQEGEEPCEGRWQTLPGYDENVTVEIDGNKMQAVWRCLFWKPDQGIMHAKVYMFRFTTVVRVCVCSANPSKGSWCWQRENIWVQDFPLINNNNTRSDEGRVPPSSSIFGDDLCLLLTHMRVTPMTLKTFGIGTLQDLQNAPVWTDFSGARARLVMSIPGEWPREGASVERFGHLHLRRVLRELGWKEEYNARSKMYMQSGSIGGDYGHVTFFDDFMLSFGAADPDEYPQNQRHEDSHEEDVDLETSNPLAPCGFPKNLSIYFPSRQLGQRNLRMLQRFASRLEFDIHSQLRSWQSAAYPNSCFRDVTHPGDFSGEVRIPFHHSKFYLRVLDEDYDMEQRQEGQQGADDEDGRDCKTEQEKRIVGFIYIGSHNFSKNAWGYTRPSTVGGPLICNSVEAGVILTTTSFEEVKQWMQQLPFEINAKNYKPYDIPFDSPAKKQKKR